MYSDTLLDHFGAPRNVGMMRSPDAVGESEDPSWLPDDRRHAATLAVDAPRDALRRCRAGGSRETSHA
jgi:hypothetical protein